MKHSNRLALQRLLEGNPETQPTGYMAAIWQMELRFEDAVAGRLKMVNEEDRETILDHARAPFHQGSCGCATHTGQFENPSCGDSLQIELRVNASNQIEEAWFQSQGCIINRAGGSMLVELLEGKSIEEALLMTRSDILALLDSPLTPRRQMCFLIAYFAFRRAIGSSEENHKPKQQST